MSDIKAKQRERNKTIIKTSIITIIANVILAGFKGAIGLATHSISVILDAVNNLSDALSSIITIVGTKLSVKQPDERHPLGYGRIEYLSAMIVAGIVLYAGITSMVESIKKIVHPQNPTFTTTSIIILTVFVAVKLILSIYVVKTGERVDSMSLIASGKDAGFDAVLSTSVLISIIIYLTTDVLLEAWIGVLISIFIIKAGLEMIIDTLDEILGKRTDPALSKQIKKAIAEDPDINGAYDLIINSYGPETQIGSVHIEVADTMTVAELDRVERRTVSKIYRDFGVLLTGIGIYSRNSMNPEITAIEDDVKNFVVGYEGVVQMHGFYLDLENKIMKFDIIISYKIKDRTEIFNKVKTDLENRYSEYSISMNMDIDL